MPAWEARARAICSLAASKGSTFSSKSAGLRSGRSARRRRLISCTTPITSSCADNMGTVSIDRALYPVRSSKLRSWRRPRGFSPGSCRRNRSAMLMGRLPSTACPTMERPSTGMRNSFRSMASESFCESMKCSRLVSASAVAVPSGGVVPVGGERVGSSASSTT
jgi:hypothetical protein